MGATPPYEAIGPFTSLQSQQKDKDTEWYTILSRRRGTAETKLAN